MHVDGAARVRRGKYLVFELASMCYSLRCIRRGALSGARARTRVCVCVCVCWSPTEGWKRGLMRMWTEQTLVVRDCRGGQPVCLPVFFNPISRRCSGPGKIFPRRNKRGCNNFKGKHRRSLSRLEARRDVEKHLTLLPIPLAAVRK